MTLFNKKNLKRISTYESHNTSTYNTYIQAMTIIEYHELP